MTTRRSDPQAGFTLVEVLVAFAILSLTVIAGFNILADSVKRTEQIEQRLELLAAAKQELTRVEAGLESRTAADPRLRVSIAPLGGDAGEQGAARPQLVRIWAADEGAAPLLESVVILPEAPK
jgi:general secretion pathway protein I